MSPAPSVYLSKDHTDPKSGHELSYSFVHEPGISSGGLVKILIFDEDSPEGSRKIGELEIHKDALIYFMARLVRESKSKQIGALSDLAALGL